MKIHLSAHQHKIFRTADEILFEELLSEEELKTIQTCSGQKNSFRTNPLVKKLLGRKDVGLIIHELTESSQIRILRDEWFDAGSEIDLTKIAYQGILLGVAFNTHDTSLIFFSTKKPFEIEHPSLVAIYGRGDSLFVENRKDPHLQDLQKEGYEFGDRLKQETHPFIYH